MKANILVVDDERTIRESVAMILSEEGYESDMASDGKEALEKLNKYDYDVLITDLKMPEISGIDLTSQALVGNRRIDENDPLFRGHFPDNPVYPGVLQLEMLSELFCCLYYFVNHNSIALAGPPVHLRGTRIHDALLQHPVLPGDDLVVVTKALDLTPYTYTGIGQILNGDMVSVMVIGEFFIVDP